MTNKRKLEEAGYSVKDNGRLVTVETRKGVHVVTMRREQAIKTGLIKPKRSKSCRASVR